MNTAEEYKGCRNCKYQPEPMQTCDWIKHQKEVYRVCPMWELKENKGGGMMERLTEWKDNRKLLAKTKFSGDFGSANVLGRLAEYEDLEEQGLLLRLPCKVGDEIYVIPSEVNYRLNKSFGAKGLNAVCRQVVGHIEFNSYGYLISTNEGMTVHRQEAFGETWFLTREEAEQKLKEMESD